MYTLYKPEYTGDFNHGTVAHTNLSTLENMVQWLIQTSVHWRLKPYTGDHKHLHAGNSNLCTPNNCTIE